MKLKGGAVEATDPLIIEILRQIFVLTDSVRYQETPPEHRLKNKIPKHKKCTAVLEFGTYHGLGTTLMVLQAIPRKVHGKPYKIPFITCEANESNCKIARENINKIVKWVTVKHGVSLGFDEMIEFIEGDEALIHHERYPDILIDSMDPIQFYKDEILGQLACFGKSTKGRDRQLYRFLPLMFKGGRVPLFVLDSAGGVGFLEYQRVVELAGPRTFYVWTHDINHVKHFRSLGHMKHSPNAELLFETEEWALALFN